MTDNQKIAYEWAKSHDYPSIAARYARELAGLVDDLQGAYDAMVRDLTARTRQVRQLQGENSALRQQETVSIRNGLNEPLTPDELREMPCEPVYIVVGCASWWDIVSYAGMEYLYLKVEGSLPFRDYGKNWTAYRQKPEEGTV